MNKKNIAIILFVLMFCGLFWSRALLSVVQAAWLVFALCYYREWKNDILCDPMFRWSLVPLLLFLLGVWQQPLQEANYDYLLTLSTYPVTVLAVRTVSFSFIKKYWLLIWGGATAAGLAYPLTWYLLHAAGVNKAYGMGQSLPTFMDTDHVRFSIFLCGSFLLAWVYMNKASLKNKLIIGVLLLAIVFLSVRTAWVILFVLLFFLFVGQSAKKISAAIKVLCVIGLVAITTYALFPTVRQKLAYTIYDWQQYKPGTYDSNYSDGVRRAINYTAWQAVQHADGANTGWAGVPATLQHYFTQYFPGASIQYGWPFNQYLFWWMGSGWWGMLLFSIWLLYPAIYGWKYRNPGLICWTAAIALSCLVECTLTLQYGVWLHIWVLALVWHREPEHK